MALSDKQRENIQFFKSELPKWLKDDLMNNKFVLIYDKKLIQSYTEFEDALKDAVVRYADNEYVIQQVINSDETVQFIHVAA